MLKDLWKRSFNNTKRCPYCLFPLKNLHGCSSCHTKIQENFLKRNSICVGLVHGKAYEDLLEKASFKEGMTFQRHQLGFFVFLPSISYQFYHLNPKNLKQNHPFDLIVGVVDSMILCADAIDKTPLIDALTFLPEKSTLLLNNIEQSRYFLDDSSPFLRKNHPKIRETIFAYLGSRIGQESISKGKKLIWKILDSHTPLSI